MKWLEGDGSCEKCQEENINVPDETSENLKMKDSSVANADGDGSCEDDSKKVKGEALKIIGGRSKCS